MMWYLLGGYFTYMVVHVYMYMYIYGCALCSLPLPFWLAVVLSGGSARVLAVLCSAWAGVLECGLVC